MPGKLKMKRYVPRYVKSGRLSETHEYDLVSQRRGMIARRGQRFFLDVEFSEPLDDYDLFSFKVQVTDYGQEHLQREWHLKEAPLRFLDDNSYDCPLQVRSTIHYTGSTKLTVVFWTAPNCIPAKYWITKLYAERTPQEKYEFDLKFSVSVIFNAFHPDDPVYMENAEERDEYVMEDYGVVYYGSSRGIGGKAWYFGQYDDPVLDCTYLLLAKSGLELNKWRDPVEVARTLSALVNSNDDAGVLVGNWSGDYSGGQAPTEWKGSLQIIKRYYEKQEPVCFGQCWVFSGVLTSLARSVGIPARSVTNFDSAHDTNANMIIDTVFDEDLNPMNEMNRDSIWNFHVWNDMWMKRPDLGEGYDGWQAVDATPQERSESIFRTGPCPLKAIKEGRVELPYDGPFVFAEVNACVKHWQLAKDGSKKELFSDPRKVGKFISTKAVGSNERLDVTDQYKYPEGSREEDNAFKNAKNSKKFGSIDRSDDNKKRRSLQAKIVADDYCVSGNDLVVKLEVSSTARTEKKAQFAFNANLKKYNGEIMKSSLAVQKGELAIKPNATEAIELTISANDYSALAGREVTGIQLTAVVIDKADKNEKLAQETVVTLFNPDMFIEIAGEVSQNKAFHFKCAFTNTLPIPLTECTFSIEGPGLRGEILEQKVGTVKPDATSNCSITLTPLRAGERKFLAAFNSKELKGIVSEYPVYVTPDPKAVVEDEIIPEKA